MYSITQDLNCCSPHIRSVCVLLENAVESAEEAITLSTCIGIGISIGIIGFLFRPFNISENDVRILASRVNFTSAIIAGGAGLSTKISAFAIDAGESICASSNHSAQLEVKSATTTFSGDGKFRCGNNSCSGWSSSETSTLEARIKEEGTSIGSSEGLESWSVEESTSSQAKSAACSVNSNDVMECWSIEVPNGHRVEIREVYIEDTNLAVSV